MTYKPFKLIIIFDQCVCVCVCVCVCEHPIDHIVSNFLDKLPFHPTNCYGGIVSFYYYFFNLAIVLQTWIACNICYLICKFSKQIHKIRNIYKKNFFIVWTVNLWVWKSMKMKKIIRIKATKWPPKRKEKFIHSPQHCSFLLRISSHVFPPICLSLPF